MLCKNPYMIGALKPVPCTKCMPCRFNRRRLWSHRMILESFKHNECSFLTLTYDDDHLPAGGTLVPRDVQLFIKRLRKAVAPAALRYFFVGEYGDRSWRPHYHAALFGVGVTASDLVHRAWGLGHVMLGDLTPKSAQYIAGYCTKKMTAVDDPRLGGRHPEFTRMSLRPGIGALALGDLTEILKRDYCLQHIIDTGDVPNSLKVGGKTMPLGRYMRRKLRELIGVYNVNPVTGEVSHGAPKEILQKIEQEVLVMFKSSFPDKEVTSHAVKSLLISSNMGRVASMEARAKIFNQRSVL